MLNNTTNLATIEGTRLPSSWVEAEEFFAPYDLLIFALEDLWNEWDDTEDEIEFDEVVSSLPIRYAQWAYRVGEDTVFISGSYIPGEDGETDSVSWSICTTRTGLATEFIEMIENVPAPGY